MMHCTLLLKWQTWAVCMWMARSPFSMPDRGLNAYLCELKSLCWDLFQYVAVLSTEIIYWVGGGAFI